MPTHGDQYRAASATDTSNPFQTETPRMNVYTARQIAQLQSKLDRQLGPEYISTRPGAGGGKVHYLAAEKVINLANEVFGFNGWSSQIQNVQIDFVDDINGKISLGLSVVMRVILKDGTFHEDIGYGHIENCKGKAAAFEKAKKEAATDALKRALRNFGNVLGNCLYDKDYLSRVTKMKTQPSKWNADNLHRHADFASAAPNFAVAATSLPPHADTHTTDVKKERPYRPQLHSSDLSGDAEDEFGDNMFDGVELHDANPDHIHLRDDEERPPPRADFSSCPTAARTLSAKGPDQSLSRHLTPPDATTIIPSIGFVTGKAAGMLSEGIPNANVLQAIPKFNPNAESPSIRKTSGVDHASSRPVLRQSLQSTASPRPVGNAPNVVNPSADPSRRIGMPPPPVAPAASPGHMSNRSAYKPPGPAAGVKRVFEASAPRSPLRDVSNVSTVTGDDSIKKTRLSDADPAQSSVIK